MSEETMTPQEGSGELTVRDAANAFEGLMSSAEDSKEQPEANETEVVEASGEETESPDVSEEDTEVEFEDSEEDESDVEEDEQPATYRVKASGEEKDVTIDELIQSYQLGADYTKKTQEVAEARKVIESEAKAIVEAKQVRDTYAQRLQAIEQFLVGNNTQEDLVSMKENDPIGYAVAVAELTEKKEQLQAVRAEQQRIAQQQQAEQSQAMQRFVAQEAQKLSSILPEFSDKVKGEQIRNEIRNYGKNVGFTDEELSQVYDSRYVVVLHKAAMYDKLQKSKPGVQKKVSEAPKMIKSGNKVQQGTTDVAKKQKQRLLQTGKVRDAAALFENLI